MKADHILDWAWHHVVALLAVHIPGVGDWQADFLCYQQLIPGGWSLHLDVFNSIFQCWGKPDVELLGSRFNMKLDRLLFRMSNPQENWVDALVTPQDLIYALTPV